MFDCGAHDDDDEDGDWYVDTTAAESNCEIEVDPDTCVEQTVPAAL